MSKKFAVPAAFGVAAVWFGGHAGGGFATGRQEASFFVQYGWTAAWIPLLSMVLLGIAFYFGIEFARINKTYDYKSFVDKLYAPYEKLFANLFDFVYLYVIVLATGAAIAGAASLIQKALGMPYGLAVIVTGLVLLVFTVFGADLVRNASAGMSVFLIASLILVTILGIKSGGANISQVLAAKPVTAGFGKILLSGILYASFQSMLIGPLVSVSEPLKTQKDTFNAALVGTIINGVILMFVCFMLLGYYPAIVKEALPVYFVTGQLGQSWLYVLYSLILFFALISTGVSFVFGGVKRFENAWSWSSLQVRRITLSVVFMAVSAGVSLFGLIAIVAKGYSSLGYICIFLNLIPLLFIAPYKIKQAKQVEASDTDV